ncbi:MAG TPA: hypothetical protein VFM08_05360 [Nocardioides sp.]|jgi:hypothetical protein|nr:hypothetical protein [Nocardioides sp.]
MSEQDKEFVAFEVEDDVEGHLEKRPPLVDGATEDDVEGHVQPPRGDDTDHVHSVVRQ